MGSSMVLNSSDQRPATSLRILIPLVFTFFVALGTIGLLLVFEHRQQTEECDAFAQLARVNAAFMERTKLPRTRQVADRLSEVIGAEVFFRDPDAKRIVGPTDAILPDGLIALAVENEVVDIPGDRLLIMLTDEFGVRTLFLRERRFGGLRDLGSEAWLAVGFFWLLSIGLGYGLSRWVSAPLRSLVKALPKVGVSGPLPPLPAKRRDEIGALARVINETHDKLLDERQRRRQAERLALLGRMATGIAHEIRNPAAAIRLHAELLDATDPESMAQSRKLILDEAGRLENLVSQWVNFSRPEPPVTRTMNLISMMRDVVEAMSPQACHMNVEIRMREPSEGEILVQADRHRLHQVFTNLTLNAIQAMPKGGVVDIGIVPDCDEVVITIKDQGSGFSDSALERAGEAFFSEREGGLGLGLAVANDICVAHGGSLTAENKPGNGACIRVVLPKHPRQIGGLS